MRPFLAPFAGVTIAIASILGALPPQSPAGPNLGLVAGAAAPTIARWDRAGPPPATRATLLVVNKSDDTVAFVDPEALRVDTTLAVGHGPHEIAVSPDGRIAYVSNYGTREQPGRSISVIDVPARCVVSTIALDEPGPFLRPHGLALTRDGRRLYVTAEANQAVLEIDVSAERIARVFPSEQRGSHMAALAPDESTLYVTNLGSGSLTAIRLRDGVSRRISMGRGPEGLAVSPDGRFLWVANRGDGNLMVVDAATGSVVDTVAAGKFPIRVAFAREGGRVLVSCAEGHELAVFDARERKLLERVPTGEMPIGVLVEPDGRHAWVSQSQRDRVTRYDLSTLKAVGHVIPGREPDGLGWAAPAGAEAGAPSRSPGPPAPPAPARAPGGRER